MTKIFSALTIIGVILFAAGPIWALIFLCLAGVAYLVQEFKK
jgi:hypothetical protein